MRSRHGQSRCIRSAFWPGPEGPEIQAASAQCRGVLPDNGQVFPFPELDPLGDTFGVLTEESGTTVVNWYAADAYSRLCRTMHQWYQEGLILRNASLRDEPATDRMRLGNSFGFFCTTQPGFTGLLHPGLWHRADCHPAGADHSERLYPGGELVPACDQQPPQGGTGSS